MRANQLTPKIKEEQHRVVAYVGTLEAQIRETKCKIVALEAAVAAARLAAGWEDLKE